MKDMTRLALPHCLSTPLAFCKVVGRRQGRHRASLEVQEFTWKIPFYPLFVATDFQFAQIPGRLPTVSNFPENGQ